MYIQNLLKIDICFLHFVNLKTNQFTFTGKNYILTNKIEILYGLYFLPSYNNFYYHYLL